MSRVPKSRFRTDVNGNTRADIEDQGNRSTVQISGHIAHGLRYLEFEDCSCIMGVLGRGFVGSGNQFNVAGELCVMALEGAKKYKLGYPLNRGYYH